MLEKLRDFFEYGPLMSAAQIKADKERIARAKKRAADRARRRREELIHADQSIGRVDRYVFGVTAEDVVRNRHRYRRQLRQDFRRDHEDEILHAMFDYQGHYKTLRRHPDDRTEDWMYDDEELDARAWRNAERKVFRRYRDEYTPDFDQDPDADLERYD